MSNSFLDVRQETSVNTENGSPNLYKNRHPLRKIGKKNTNRQLKKWQIILFTKLNDVFLGKV